MIRDVVIVGGGIAGVSTAAALRRGGFDGTLTLVDAGEFPYDRPPLSKDFLSAAKGVKDLALQPESFYAEQNVRLLNRTIATQLRPGEGAVELSSGGVLHADRIVLATGGRAARPPIRGADDERVHVLRTAADAERLAAALVPGASVFVVGAGLIGAEVAATAAELGCEVTLADPASPPLGESLGREMASWLHGFHAERGIALLSTGVSSLDDIPADVVILAVGMVPETALAQSAGIEVDRGVLVDRSQVTSNPAVLAVGDPARPRGGLRAEHWEAAQLDGQRAAATLLGTRAPAASAPWFWTDRHGLHVEVVGEPGRGDQIVRGVLGEPPFSVFGHRDGRVVGAVAVNDPTAVRAARRMVDRAVTVDPQRLADPNTNLRKLLHG